MKRIGILVVAYNAASTLAQVLDRIPASFRSRVEQVLVFDDHSQDSTYLVGLGYQQATPDLPLSVIRHPRNLGYGGNQKAGYRWAIEHDLDLIVLLHGDGQYAPEVIEDIVEPLESDSCDAVLGSRTLVPGAARRGGMPLYKYVGNRILTRAQNAITGASLSEWHSGYRAYSVSALRDIPFEANSDGFDFDTQVIVQLIEAGKEIREVPIPTYYGDEICYVNGIRYARDVLRDVIRYRAHKMGLGSGETAFASRGYELKEGEGTSHGTVLRWLHDQPPARILDLGCSDGALAAELHKMGHTLVGVDREESPAVADALESFVEADLDRGIPDEVGDGFDVILAADVLEHVRSPARVLEEARRRLAPGGWVLVSIPNFSHWYPRIRTAIGRFDYDRRGILDSDHVRFFTRRSFERIARSVNLTPKRCEAVGFPFPVVGRGGRPGAATGRVAGLGARIDQAGVSLWPSMFAYQYVLRLEPSTC